MRGGTFSVKYFRSKFARGDPEPLASLGSKRKDDDLKSSRWTAANLRATTRPSHTQARDRERDRLEEQ
eukprot:12525434-Heterocapsa_arctica.AAC.1